MQLLHEVWKTQEGGQIMLLASKDHDRMRAKVEPDARLIHSFFASSRDEAMQLYYDWNGWGQYKREPTVPDLIYTHDELRRQGITLADRIGS